jgi:hypothetical protein
MISRTLQCLVVCSLALANFAAEAKSGARTGAVEATIGATLDPLVTDGQLAGYVTVLMKNGKPVATNVQGHAEVATLRPMTKDTIFRIYSMTKPVTGVALLILHDRGKWKFSNPIAKHLPELADLKVYRGVDAAGNDDRLFLNAQHRGMHILGAGPHVGSAAPTPPLSDRLGVDPVPLGQRPQALLTILYCLTDCRCRAGAPVKNLAHSASFHSCMDNAPSNSRTKQLG